MKITALAGCILLFTGAFAQDGRNYRLLADIQRRLSADTTPWKHVLAAYDYSFAGHYKETLSCGDSLSGPIRQKARLSGSDATYVGGFRPVPARDYILKRSAAEKILIINEAHHQPLHRTFVTSLLKDLYQQGYRYFGIETLSHGDSLLHQRKYPVQTTGFYSFEPQFGNMIREALRIGFILFPYETTVADHNGKEREIDQAKNIAHFMQQHTTGKYLIYCGYAHVIEGPYPTWEKAMAGRLKEYTGINPFTIDQETLTEHSTPLYERPDYAAIRVSFPAVCINQQNEVYNGLARDSSVDVVVYHPRTTYVHGRPNWLLLNGRRKACFVPSAKITIRYPLLALAYAEGEDTATAIPHDVVELRHARENKALILPKGRYILMLKNEQQMQTLKIEVK